MYYNVFLVTLAYFLNFTGMDWSLVIIKIITPLSPLILTPVPVFLGDMEVIDDFLCLVESCHKSRFLYLIVYILYYSVILLHISYLLVALVQVPSPWSSISDYSSPL